MLDISRTKLADRQMNCPNHGAYTSAGEALAVGRTTREIRTTCPGCADAAVAAARDAEATRVVEQGKDRAAALLVSTGIPKRFIGRTLEQFRSTTPEQDKAKSVCVNFADHFLQYLESGRGLILAGKPGTGKSHLACAILQQILPNHVGLYFTTMDLVRLLRESWGGGKGESESSVLDRVGGAPLLVIDELGVQFGSDGERVHIHDVLDRRYRNQLPTILITNEDNATFKACVGDRVFDRLTETARRVEFNWPSHRPEARKEYV